MIRRLAALPLLVLVAGLVVANAADKIAPVPKVAPSAFILGTWAGTSKCLGNRPTCKDESVVYRFETIQGHPDQVRQYADKILGGKRVPMGTLDYLVDARHDSVRCEFTRGHTHGLWEYHVDGDSLTGRLVIFPDSTIGRDVKAHRVKEKEVPPAPAPKDYEE